MSIAQNSDLTPRLGFFSASMILIGSIIGSGIFKKIGPMSEKLHSPTLVLWCWFLAGIITLLGALTYAEIAGRWAQTGGLYSYLRIFFGPFWAYVFGWSCFSVIQSASIASIAFVFAEALREIFPYFLPKLTTSVLAAMTVLLLTGINCLGVLFGALVENIFTVVKIAGLLIVTILAFLWSPTKGTESSLILTEHNVTIPIFFSAMLSAFWAYDGLNNIGFIGGEIKNPKKNIPRSLVFGISGILIIYLLVNLSFFHALPLREILNIAALKNKIFAVELIQRTYGESWSLFVALLILVSTFGATNGSILSSARIYFSMAKDGLFFSFVGKANPQTQAPVAALLLQGAWASALIFVGSFDDLTDMLIFASFIFYGLGAVGLVKNKKLSTNYEGFKAPAFVPIIYILFCLSFVLMTLFQDPMGSLKGLGLIALGLPFYLICPKIRRPF